MSDGVGCQACGRPVPLGTPGEGPARFFCDVCRKEFGELVDKAEAIKRADLDKLRRYPVVRGFELIGETLGALRRRGKGP